MPVLLLIEVRSREERMIWNPWGTCSCTFFVGSFLGRAFKSRAKLKNMLKLAGSNNKPL
jgi:hypothetical protein